MSRPVAGSDLQAPPVWRMLEEAGIPVGTFHVSLADSSQEISGFRVSWDGARREAHRNLVHPPDLYAPLIAKFGRWTTTTRAQTRREWASLVPREIEIRADILIELLRTRPWRFALARFIEIGRAQHRFWDDESGTLQRVYAAVDRAIARIVAAVGPETVVFVFSECGAGTIRHAVHLDAWLEREGFLNRRKGTVQRAGFQLARVHKRLRRVLPRTFDLSGLKMRVRSRITASNIDWSRTRAFALGDTSEIVFRVPASEHAGLAEQLRARLLTLRDPDGRRVVEDVIYRPGGKAPADAAPDLIVVWENDAYMPMERFDDSGRIFEDWCPELTDWKFTGSHRREGMLLVGGAGIGNEDVGKVRLIDLVPTWLELLGAEIPAGLEGSSFAARLFDPA
jgi:predicted AlkP superfamily phosphohydrolase/phosphomutase